MLFAKGSKARSKSIGFLLFIKFFSEIPQKSAVWDLSSGIIRERKSFSHEMNEMWKSKGVARRKGVHYEEMEKVGRLLQ